MLLSKPKIGLSLMPTEDFREATTELFTNDKVEVLEWSFDFGWNGAVLDPGVSKFSTASAIQIHYWGMESIFLDCPRDSLSDNKNGLRKQKVNSQFAITFMRLSILVSLKPDQSSVVHH